MTAPNPSFTAYSHHLHNSPSRTHSVDRDGPDAGRFHVRVPSKETSIMTLLGDASSYSGDNPDLKKQSSSFLKPLQSGSSKIFKPTVHWWRKQSWWPKETFNWFLTLAFFAATIGLLAYYDGKDVPEWQWGISLNAVVSLLVTVATFTLMVPVAAGIAQLKWIHFQDAKPLRDFEIIENASRGPTGSLTLLLHRRGGYLAGIGALLTIANLAIPAFVQQIIRYQSAVVITGTASMPTATNFKNVLWNDGLGQDYGYSPDLQMRFAMYSGMLTIEPVAPIAHECPTGNCTWPLYHTLAVCSLCQDISDSVTSHTYPSPNPLEEIVQFTLPNDYNEKIVGVNMSRNSAVDGNIHGILTLEAEQVASKVPPTTNQTFFTPMALLVTATGYSVGPAPEYEIQPATSFEIQASQCQLQFCVKSFTATQNEGGTFQEFLANPPWFNSTDPYGSWVTTLVYNHTLSPPGLNETFTVWGEAAIALTDYLNSAFQNVTIPGPMTVSDGDQTRPGMFGSDAALSVFNAFNSTGSMNLLMDNMALSMTNNIRTNKGAGPSASGVAMSTKSVIQIEWPWMVLPLALLFLSLIFLLLLVAKTRAQKLSAWRTNSLATIFHGLDDEDRMAAGLLDEKHVMEMVGKEMQVKMVYDALGWKLKRVE